MFSIRGGVVVVGRPFPAERLDDRLADGVAKNYRQLNLSCNTVSQPQALENQFGVGSLRNRSFVQLALVDEGRKSVILDIAGYPPGERRDPLVALLSARLIC